jgi:hypothetical protein
LNESRLRGVDIAGLGLIIRIPKPSEGYGRAEVGWALDLILFYRVVSAMRYHGKPWNRVQKASKARPATAKWSVTILRGIDTGKL